MSAYSSPEWLAAVTQDRTRPGESTWLVAITTVGAPNQRQRFVDLFPALAQALVQTAA
jgi:hypothetical protein